jgi:hypothetical protein
VNEVQVLRRLVAQAAPDDEHRPQAQKRLEEIEKSKVPPAALGLPEASPPPPAATPPEAKPPEAKPPEAKPVEPKAPDAAGK